METDNQPLYQKDLDQTRVNRERLKSNANLMFWYQELFQELFDAIPNISQKRVLEIGSGASPLKSLLPTAITTDILELEYLDIVFDCHDIQYTDSIPDHSLDVIVLTNVLHHLRNPLQFLRGAAKKLAPGGQVWMTEPYFSCLSYPLYKTLHHEPVNFNIERPLLEEIKGPLSTSNQAMPYMIFFSRPDWQEGLADCYNLQRTQYGFFTSLSYMATGGISRTFPVPGRIYRACFKLDRWLARCWPKVFASFFSARLLVKEAQ
jgi:hypothetical protein